MKNALFQFFLSVLCVPVEVLMWGVISLYLRGISPTHFASFPQQMAAFPQPDSHFTNAMPLCQKLKSKFTILRFVSSFGLNSVQNVLGGLRTDVTLATRVSLETFLTTCVLLGLYFPHVRFYECVK